MDLLEEDAVRSKFNEAVSEHNPNLIIFYDHGSTVALIGNDGKPLMDKSNVLKVANREVYTMCCSAAADLGVRAYRNKCKAWWGYVKPFAFTTDREVDFCEFANLGLRVRMVTGCTWPKALERVTYNYNEKIDEMREEGGDPWAIIAMVNNKNALVVYTDETPPESDCFFRNMGAQLFGPAGQYVTRTAAVSVLLLFVSYGVALHDFAHSVYEVKGTAMSLEGGYLGFAGMLAFSLILLGEYLKWLRAN